MATWHQALRMNSPAVSSLEAFRTPAAVHPLAPAPGRHPKTLNETGPLRRGWREGELQTLPVIRRRRRDQQRSTHILTGRSASSTEAFPRKADGFLTRLAILCPSKGKLGEPSMATRQVKTARKTAPAARSNPIRKTAGKPKAAPAVLKLVTTKAVNKERTATSAPQPASMTGPLPPIVTLKHLAEWAGYNHGIPKKQAIEMFTGFVADIGRVLKKGSKIRIPNFGVLQVRIRPARPARKGRNPATGEEIQIKASKASKKVAFRVAKGLREAI